MPVISKSKGKSGRNNDTMMKTIISFLGIFAAIRPRNKIARPCLAFDRGTVKSLRKFARVPFGVAMALTISSSFSMADGVAAVPGPESITGSVTPGPSNQWGLFYYTVKNGEITIIDFAAYSNSSPDVVFPAKIDGLPVTRLGSDVFEYFGDDGEERPRPITIRSISIPASVTHIAEGFFFGQLLFLQEIIVDPGNRNFTSVEGILYDKKKTTLIRFPNGVSGDVTISTGVKTIADHAFSDCSVTNVQLPNSVTRIGVGVFEYCGNLENITLPDGLRVIEKDAFLGCRSLKGVSIPDGVTTIGDNAFDACASLKQVELPNSITRIGSRAFFSSGLVSVAIPASVTRIGFQAFAGCSNLISIEVAPANTKYSSTSGLLLNKKKTVLLTCLESRSGAVEIPVSVTLIRDWAFSNCRGLTSILIPVGVAEIGKNAFAGCSGLKEVTIPKSVKFIKDGAFSNCHGLTSVRIPVGVSEIGNHAFANCLGLKEVTIPGTASRIGEAAFNSCSALESLTLKNGIARIESYAFLGCISLTSLTIPGSVTKMGDCTFMDCSSLKTAEIRSGGVSLGMFDGCRNLTSVSLAAVTRVIGHSAFNGCGSLTSIIIPAGATSIGSYAFWGCASLKKVTFHRGLSRIENRAFAECRNLKHVVFPDSVSWISGHAFSRSGLEGAYFKGNAPSMNKSVFDGAAPGFTVYFLKSKTGFTTPMWKGYPAVGLDSLPAATFPTGELADTAPPNCATSIPFRDLLSQSGMMPPRVIGGKTWINGRKYLTLTYQKPAPDDGIVRVVEVSSNLVDWFSGPKHTTVVGDSANIIKVRDNTPIEPGKKRFIRIRTPSPPSLRSSHAVNFNL